MADELNASARMDLALTGLKVDTEFVVELVEEMGEALMEVARLAEERGEREILDLTLTRLEEIFRRVEVWSGP